MRNIPNLLDKKNSLILRTIFSAAAFILFSIWAVNLDLFLPFKVFFPYFHLIFAFTAVTVFLISKKIMLKDGDLKNLKLFFYILPAVGFFASLSISFIFFQGMPHIQDSVDYLVMAQNLKSGKWHSEMPEHYEFFKFLYMIPDGEKFYSMFLPGFSFFLVPFVILGFPVIANPLLTALNVYLTGMIAKKLFDEKIAVISMQFALMSSFLIVMGGTFMAHSFCAVMTLSAIYFYILSLEKDTWKYPLLTGAAIGWLMLIRPQNAVFIALPLALHALLNIRNDFVFKNGLKTVAAFIPFFGFLMFYNWMYTGNPFIFKQDIYFNYSEPATMCHRFGIGSGCPYSNWIEMPKEGLTWSHAVLVSFRRLSPLIMNLFLHPLTIIFIYIAFLFAKKQSDIKLLSSLFIIFLFTFAGYFFFYFDGNVFGPRYYYETSFLLVIIIAYGFMQTEGHVRVIAVSLVISGFIFQSAVIVPELYHSYKNGFWDIDAKLGEAVKEKGIQNAIVFVSPKHLYGSGFALMDHSDIDKNSVIYGRDLGEKQNSRLMGKYPHRSYYLAKFKKPGKNTEPPKIIEIKPKPDYGNIHIELEDKSYPLTGSPDYCNIFPEKSYLDKYFEMEPPYKYLQFGQWFFFCRFVSTQQYYDFGQKFNDSGKYEMIVKAVSGPEMGKFKVLVDDKYTGVIDFNSPVEEFKLFSVEMKVKKGFRSIKLQPSELVSPLNYFFIDYIEFVPRR